jgi:MerR family mercuric resistance operon transcriptional regulator
MRIGELAKQGGVNVQTLRFYEREGLLPKPPRTSAGYRRYARADLDRLRLIRSCQDIGFTLNDVREILELHRVLAARKPAESIKPKAQAKLLATADRRLALIDEKLRTLRRMKNHLGALVATLAVDQKPVCPVSGMRVT